MSGRRLIPGWLLLAGVCGAFAAFEITKHLGWTVPGALLGALLPFAARLRPMRVLAHWAPPLVVLVAFTVVPETQAQAAPGFTLGLVWLTHVALARGIRRESQA
ncbi:hypothetical protein ABZ863_19105 [Saccharomonospora sp. NPDC046836]|uniref:hypothetical protein n=1 Tax=Saccharomonospora sp. NPDC046836 TaxID=3156921 RepID=UPI003402D365